MFHEFVLTSVGVHPMIFMAIVLTNVSKIKLPMETSHSWFYEKSGIGLFITKCCLVAMTYAWGWGGDAKYNLFPTANVAAKVKPKVALV